MKITSQILQSLRYCSTGLFSHLVKIRRDLHQHPELSGQESWTADYLAAELARIGLKVAAGVGGHGLMADLVSDPSKPTVALRVDMDALPIHEINDVPYRSKFPGVMHACGHDVHAAIGIGVAAVLKSLQADLPGNIRFIFQPEEEEITGALKMIRAGALENPRPRAIFGLHVAPFPAGQLAWTDDLFLAGFDHYLVTLTPQKGTTISPQHLDAISRRCCQVIQSFNEWTLPENWEQMQAFWDLMQKGPHNLRNFIIYEASTNDEDPEEWRGQFGVGIKAANFNLRKTAVGRIKATLNTICRATQTNYRLEQMGHMPDMRNHPQLVRATLPVLNEILGENNLIQLRAAFPFNCEDFAYYTKAIPGAMVWLGAANPQENKYALLHTPDFDVDEICLLQGTRALAAILFETLLNE